MLYQRGCQHEKWLTADNCLWHIRERQCVCVYMFMRVSVRCVVGTCSTDVFVNNGCGISCFYVSGMHVKKKNSLCVYVCKCAHVFQSGIIKATPNPQIHIAPNTHSRLHSPCHSSASFSSWTVLIGLLGFVALLFYYLY